MNEEDFLLLSGIQHFAFCPRQWALIHLEGTWAENERTVLGEIMHERCHDETFAEKRGDLLTVRGMRIHSAALGISGACDVVEFTASPDGVPLAGREGLWKVTPVEYKKGEPKEGNADALQLCAEGMCLEEMLLTSIEGGFLYYGEIRRREYVEFSDELRAEVVEITKKMGELLFKNITPKAKRKKACNACSLQEKCLPTLEKCPSASEWVQTMLLEEEP